MAGLTDSAILEAWRRGGGGLERLSRTFPFRFGSVEVREVLNSGTERQSRLLTQMVLSHWSCTRPRCTFLEGGRPEAVGDAMVLQFWDLSVDRTGSGSNLGVGCL